MRIIALLAMLAVTAVAGGAKAEVSPRPSCVATARVADGAAADRIDCFAIDKASELRQWSGAGSWASLGPVSHVSRSVSCLKTRDGYLHCFYVRRDGQIWHRRWLPDAPRAATLEAIGGVPLSPAPGALIRPGFVDHMANELTCMESGDNNIACMVQTVAAPDGRFYGEPGLYVRRYLTSIGGWSAWQSMGVGWRTGNCRWTGTSLDYCTLHRFDAAESITRHILASTHDYGPVFPSGEAPLAGLVRTTPLVGPRDSTGAYPHLSGGLQCLHVLVRPDPSVGEYAFSQHCAALTDTRQLYFGSLVARGPREMTWSPVADTPVDLSPGSGVLTGDEQAPNCQVMNPPASRADLSPVEDLVFTCVQVTGEREVTFLRYSDGRWTRQAIATPYIVTGAPVCVVLAATRLDCFFRTDLKLGRMNRLSVVLSGKGIDYGLNEIGRGFVYPRPPR
ncbi:hypothetical protein ABAC460_19945 [Asticcacaulis sp. AC460]|uniref:hypothetical protein n=1 Tax=Asticcacaulis sp. AC460 TaxID=1282360 RepID=UPI0003C3BD8F|nr:hypothetical protein [Asticcacaulis sp. AC460]ESQ87298.1 hypothetical protein ABAC460_19945 [Asticcacaulis sp. AC460]